MFTLIVMVLVNAPGPLGQSVNPAAAIWSQQFTWQSDCEAAAEAIRREFVAKNTVTKAVCFQGRH